MSLIINDKIRMFKVGYPTVSDKYNVSGAVLENDSDAVNFGNLVAYGDTNGYFKKAAGLTAASQVAGIVLATNVKVANEWPGSTITVNPGEAFNLLLDGYVAAELDSGASVDTVAAVACVAAASTDTTVAETKTYYTRESSAAGIGLLNDGSYAYTKVATPTGNPSTSSYYEVSVLGVDAKTDCVTPNAKVYVILATGKLTTSDKSSANTIVELPGYFFTGLKEYQGMKKIAEIRVK